VTRTRLSEVVLSLVGTLSRGYRQRLGLAQALLNSPSVLILDEPTNGLDPSQVLEMRSLIKELAEKATVLLSTHNLQEARAVSSRAIIIDQGRVVLDEQLIDLEKAFGLEFLTDAAMPDFESAIMSVGNLRISHARIRGVQNQYIVDTADTGDSSETAALVTRALLDKGCKVFAVQPVGRDLEVIFADITNVRSDTSDSKARS
jgi:ABC-2 type transport system ATP-binding protein